MAIDNRGNKNKFQVFLRLAIIISALVIFFLILQYNNYRTHSPLPDQALCSSCHSMQANIKTWQVTAHSQVGCSNCHNDISLTRVVSKEISDRYQKPIQKNKPVHDKQCLKCHNVTRMVTAPGDLIIPHRLHIEKQIDCVRCHSNVTHGKVTQELLVGSNKKPQEVTKEEAIELTSFGNRIPMDSCMSCHNDAKADGSCKACHTNKPIPESHNQDFMKFAHDDDALKDLSSCVKCHEYDVKKQARFDSKAKDFQSLRVYTRNNDFCQSCHQQRPVTHDDKFIISHPYGISDNKSCLVCHDRSPNELKKKPAAQNIHCNTCHNNESTHPNNYLTSHPVDLKGKDPNSCFSCHNAKSCESCHQSYGINTKK